MFNYFLTMMPHVLSNDGTCLNGYHFMNMNEDSGKKCGEKARNPFWWGAWMNMMEHAVKFWWILRMLSVFGPGRWIFLLRPFPTVGSVKSGLWSKCVTPVGSFKRYQKVRCWRLAKWQVCKHLQWFPCRDHHWCILMHILVSNDLPFQSDEMSSQ